MTVGIEIAESELALSRARVYGILAAIYSKPAGDAELDVFRQWWLIVVELVQGNVPELIIRGLGKIQSWLEDDDSNTPDKREATLQSEFLPLFRGLRRGSSPPPPYESVWVDGGVVYGPSADRVGQKYRQFNMRILNNEPPDHLALELYFMRFLCEKEAEARSTGQSVQDWLAEEEDFLGEHLAPWLPAFCEGIRESCETLFYSGVADITEGWICLDQEIIEGLIETEPLEGVLDVGPTTSR